MTHLRILYVRWALVALASGACGEPTRPPPPPKPVAAVDVAPRSATLDSGQMVQLHATPKDETGNALAGRSVVWASGNADVASVTPGGLVTGVLGGTATITASSEGKRGESAIAVVAALPPPGVSCLTQRGAVVTVSGPQPSGFSDTSLTLNTKVAASSAQFVTLRDIAIRVGSGPGLCFSGGEVMGSRPPATPYARMHDTYGLVALAGSFRLEALRVFDYGDGASMDGPEDANWTLRNVYFKYMRDDCVENDFVNSGTIENSLFDGCYAGISSRPYTATADGSNNVVVVKGSLFRLQDMDQGFLKPGHGGFFKWAATAPMIALYDNVFRADSRSVENDAMAPPPAKLKDCSGNVMIWLGSGPFPEPLPSCFRLLTGAAGVEYWNQAVAAWKANHPNAAVDAAAPIISMFAPADSTTLSGSVTLTATAVDDQAVSGVQFRLDGQPIGTETTAEGPITKFTITWDSHAQPNGSYTLTAVARDAAGHTTTSVGIPVTISN
jgi:hypothetical protein